jgi:hypothetical protein
VAIYKIICVVFEDTKDVIWSRKSKERQYNEQIEKNRNNDQQKYYTRKKVYSKNQFMLIHKR